MIGLKLLPQHVVATVHERYPEPRERLLHVLIEFTKRVEPRPTWRVIIAALRSPAVNLSYLAERVEAAHFPDLNATRNDVPEITEPTGNVHCTHTYINHIPQLLVFPQIALS